MKYTKIGALIALIGCIALVGFQNCTQKGENYKASSNTTIGPYSTPTPTPTGTPTPTPTPPPSGGPVSCTVNVQPLSHIGDTYIYQFNVVGTIPSFVHVAIFGTKANPNGSNLVTDATGGIVGMTGTQLSLQYTNPALAGNYMRFFKLINPSTNQELCTTNQVNHKLTPQCALGVSYTSTGPISNTITVSAGQTVFLSHSTNTTPALTAPAAHNYYYGTKNGVQDENGVEDWAFSLNPVPIPMSSANVGVYTRYYVSKDSSGNDLCRSNKVTITVNY